MPTDRQKKYQEYLKSDDWKRKRATKKKKRCAICGDVKNLDTHHLNYRNWYDVKPSDLRILCHRCHGLVHWLMKNGKIAFERQDHNHQFGVIKRAVLYRLKQNSKRNLYAIYAYR